MGKTNKQQKSEDKPKRIYSPKLKAATFEDKRLKRLNTRANQVRYDLSSYEDEEE